MTSEAPVADQQSTPPPKEDIGAVMDAVNLERALVDFEIANARVIELTARLTGFSQELLATRSELGLAKLRIAELELLAAELATVKGSQAYRAARLIGSSRAKLMRR